MQESSYLILGLGENATLQEVENAYKTLKEKYQKQCFEEGETGSFAAKMLSKIRIAYNDCLDDIRKKEIIGEGSIYQAIEKLVGENKLNEAQALLDETEPRGGDWHFAQAHIVFKRNWFLDSKNPASVAAGICALPKMAVLEAETLCAVVLAPSLALTFAAMSPCRW